ncbi:MAG TPA: iron-containing redox enzyme family protein [Candidatus Limnocylindria bacterium]|nr:iron-containing redox enzyme family protein [Candidatus Limnocylindria bacterium]
MPITPAAFATRLLTEAQQTHPWLHHRLFGMIVAGELSREQVRHVIREQGCFFLDTLRHAAWKIISVGGFTPTFEDLERQRALIPLVVEEGGHDTIGGKQTAHAYLFVRLCEGLGWHRDEVFGTEYLPTTIIEKNELFQLQRASTLEALCGGNIATESINHIVSARMAQAMEKHYGVPRAALDFYHEHMEVEEDHRDRALAILARVAVTDEEQKRGLLALRRAIAARRICADGMYEAFVAPGGTRS